MQANAHHKAVAHSSTNHYGNVATQLCAHPQPQETGFASSHDLLLLLGDLHVIVSAMGPD